MSNSMTSLDYLTRIQWREPWEIFVDEEKKHIVQFPDRFPLVVGAFWFSKKHKLPVNRHDYLEISLVNRGNGFFRIGDIQYPVTSGDIVLMGPNTLHTVEVEQSDRLFVTSLYFLPELVFSAGEPEENFEWLRPFYDYYTARHPVIENGRTRSLTTYFSDLVNTRMETKRYGKLQMKIDLLHVLMEVLKEYDSEHEEEPLNSSTVGDERLNRVLNWMNRNYQKRLSLDEAAEVACMSSQHLCRFFKNSTGHTFTEHLSRIRVTHAKQLLLTTNLRTTDIAYEVGFGSQSYFFRVFRQETGSSPKEFLEKRFDEASE